MPYLPMWLLGAPLLFAIVELIRTPRHYRAPWGFRNFSRHQGAGRRTARWTSKGSRIDRDTVKVNWKQFKDTFRERWGDLTDDDLDRIDGRREQLAGGIEEALGISKEEAERQFKEFKKGNRDLRPPLP